MSADKTFCMMPWVHLHVTQLGTVTPCCQAPWEASHAFGDINTQSIDEIWNGEPIRRFRAAMLRGEADSRCARCYAKESTGLPSLRLVTNHDYAHRRPWVKQTAPDGSCAASRPIYLDIRFSNVCNFRCRICGPASSSRWHEDAKALGLIADEGVAVTRATSDLKRLMDQLEPLTEGIEEIYFAGGEPLVMDEHYALLDLCLAKGRRDIRLKYNTNFSRTSFKGRDVIDTWRRFPNVIVSASLDGSHARGELQRKEQVWSETVANARRLRDLCPHVRFQVTPTVSVFNLLHLPAFHREWAELGLIDPVNFWPSVLSQPAIYNIRVLPEAIKREAQSIYREHLAWIATQTTAYEGDRERHLQFWTSVLAHLHSSDESGLAGAFVETTRRLDILRGESTPSVFPELGGLFNERGSDPR